MATERKGTSPWIYIGCGCLALVGLVILGFGGMAFWGMRQAQSYVETMSDPLAREAKAKELLGTEQLPEGYYARMYLSVPWFMDMVVLSDQPGEMGTGEMGTGEMGPEEMGPEEMGTGEINLEDLGTRAFFYFAIRDFGQEHENLRRYLSGEDDRLNMDVDLDFDFRPEETLSRGSFDHDDHTVIYAVQRGELDTRSGRHDGINTMMMVDCPSSQRLRLGMWFQAIPGVDGAVEDPGSSGAVAVSEDDIRQFMSHFNLCTD